MDSIKATKRDVHISYVEMLFSKPKWTLRYCGTWPYDDNWLYKVLACIHLFMSISIIVCQHVFIYQNRTNFDYILGAYSTMFTVIVVCIKQSLIMIHRKEYIQLLETIKNDFWPINSLDDDNSIRKLFVTVNKCFIVYLCVIITFPQVWMLFPFIDHLPGHRRMPIVSWYPFDIDKSPIHEIIYLWIIMVCLYMSLGIYGYEHIYLQFIIHICVQYKLIRRCLRSINKSNNNNMDVLEKKNDRDQHAYEELAFCIKHHILLKKFHQRVAVILNVNNGIHISTSSFALGCSLYLLQCEKDPIRVVKLIVYMICFASELAMYCFAGAVLEQVSMSISDAAYESNWCESHPRLRLGLIRLIQMTNVDPLRLTSYGMFYINNSLFISVWKTSFSLSSLILNMTDKDE